MYLVTTSLSCVSVTNLKMPFLPLDADALQRLGVRFVSIENQIEGFPLNQRDLFILVRPDRYIYGVFKAESANAFTSTFYKHLTDLIHN